MYFEVTSDYGAFRDLQRHRMLTIQWQQLSPALGHAVRDAGLGSRRRAGVGAAEVAYRAIVVDFPEQAQYLVTLGHRVRYLVKIDAREIPYARRAAALQRAMIFAARGTVRA